MRQSNMEMLRIIAMSMILIHHFMVHGLTQENMPHHLFNALNSFVFSGVNIFFILSGYFSIRYTSKGLLKLILTILFFGIVNLMLLVIVGEAPDPSMWMTVIQFPVIRSPYWFMCVYLLLYVTAPIINAGLRHIDRNVLRNTLIILTFITFYTRTSYILYSYLQGFLLYSIGYYISRYKPMLHIKRRWLLLGAFLSAALSSGLDWSLAEHGMALYGFQTYGNVLIFFCALMLVLFFRDFRFHSASINSVASASLGCYLLQDGNFGLEWLYDYQQSLLYEYGYSLQLFIIFTGFFIGFWVTSWLLTKFLGLWLPQFSGFLDMKIRSAIRPILFLLKKADSPE